MIGIEPGNVEDDLPVSSELRCNKPPTVRSLLVYERIGQLSQSKLSEAIRFLNEAIRSQELRKVRFFHRMSGLGITA